MENNQDSTFQTLYKQYYNFVFGIALRILKVREDTEEVVNDVFIQLHKQYDQIRLDQDFMGWLTTTTKCRAIDKLRKRGRQPDPVPDYEIEKIRCHIANPEKAAITNETQEIIQQAISTLKSKTLTTTYQLCFVENLDYQEAADALGCTRNAIKIHIHRCRQHIIEFAKKQYRR